MFHQFDPYSDDYDYEADETGVNNSIWPDWDPARVSKTSAMKRWRLREQDLQGLKFTTRPNPFRYAGGDVHLYLIEEVRAVAARKEQERAAAAKYRAEHAEEIELERKQRAAAVKEAAAEEAEQFLGSCKAVGRAIPPPAKAAQLDASATVVGSSSVTAGGASARGVLPPGSCNGKVPSEVLEVVVDKVIATTLTGRHRIQSCALELVTLSEVCTDFYHVVHDHGFEALADAATPLLRSQPLPTVPTKKGPLKQKLAQLKTDVEGLRSLPGPTSKKLGWRFWDLLVRDPQGFFAQFKQDTIKEGVKRLGGKVTGTKAELVVRLVQALGLKGPAAAPARLLAAVQEQRLRSQAV